jgi:hypothetical protein
MAEQQPAAREQSRSKPDDEHEHDADTGTGQNGHDEDVARYEQELAGYLQERIKPGLNSGAIPLLARSIAKEIAHGEHPHPAADDAEVADEPSAESDAAPDFEADMHELQAELGEEWILSFSVQGDDAWLTAKTHDGSQRVEAPTADVLTQAVALLNKGGGRSS